MDVLAIFDSSWFGRPRSDDLEPDPSPPPAQPHLRRGSAGSFSDLAAAGEQGQEAAGGGAAARDRKRQQQQSAAPNLMRNSGRLHQHPNGLEHEEEDGVLGTWAGRQRIFSDHLRQQQQEQERQRRGVPEQQQQQQGHHRHHLQHPTLQEVKEEEGSPAAVVLRPPAAAGHAWPTAAEPTRGGAGRESPPRGQQQTAAQPVADLLDQEMNAAWRWRFTRKWQAEQMKQFEAPAAAGGTGEEAEDEEEWSAALRMMQAVDGGLNMQIGRTLSLHNSSAVEGSVGQSLTLLSPGLGQYMLLDGSIKESPLREDALSPAPAATSAIVSVARKAQHLRQQQQEIERQVTERWEAASSGSAWLAQHLPAVQIDSWSAFPFVLVRLSEPRSQRQKLLVRGRNGCTEHQVFAATEQEASRASIAHRLPGPRVELVASGRMEWVAAPPLGSSAAAGGQRRMLRIRVSRLLPPAAKDARLHSLSGASAVVVEVTRASFPQGGFDIVVADKDGRQSAAGAAAAQRPGAN